MPRPTRFSCEEVFSRLDDYLDRELSPTEVHLLEEHLEACANCAREHRFESRVLEGIRCKVSRIVAPSDLLSRIRERLAAEQASDQSG